MGKTYRKLIVKPGVYPQMAKDGSIRKVHITADRIRRWVEKFKEMQAKADNPDEMLPMPWWHDSNSVPILRRKPDERDLNTKNTGGWWSKLWQDKLGRMWGHVTVPRDEDAERMGTTVKKISMFAPPQFVDGDDVYQDVITHIAAVTHPHVKDQGEFEPLSDDAPSESPAIAAGLSLSVVDFDEEATATISLESIGTNNDINDSGEPPQTADDATLDEVLEILREMGLSLPDDTTADNFLERVKAAAIAVKGAKKEPQQPQNQQIIEQPSPPGAVTMGETLTDDQKARLAFAEKHGKQPYRARITKLIGDRIDAKYAEETLLPMLDAVSLSFNADGDPVSSEMDAVLNALENLPSGSAVTGKITEGTAAKLGIDLSGVDEHAPDPKEFQAPATEPVTEERGQEVAKELCKMRGIPVEAA